MMLMPAETRSRSGPPSEPESDQCPDITVCESCPGTSIFIEAENTDGWIASDLTVDVPR
jgi:hypothetical protein